MIFEATYNSGFFRLVIEKEGMIHEILKDTFGYDRFRPMQQEIVEHLLDGKDSLVIMPTGGGKSICYQLPALAQEGLTIVVSPLIALMEDQVQSLLQNGVSAAALNSSMNSDEQRSIHSKISSRELKLLYVSPEKINSDRFYDYLKTIQVSFFAIDEAHCVSIWGNDFRSDYVELKKLKEHFPNIPIIALTATADAATQLDIVEQLSIPKAKIFLGSFERNNIFLRAMPAKDRIKYITRFIFNQQGGSGIVYCLSRKGTENMASKLQAAGINASFYHAGMDRVDRSLVQRNFQNDKIQVICATIAFGMGIDKPNIRFVVHYNMPKNIESYYQEIGRAGRDGYESATVLFSNYNDFLQLQQFITDSPATEQFKELQSAKLARMWEYASSYECRTNFILNYFGEYRQKPCGRCDNCKQPPRKFDGTIIAQKAISAVIRANQSIGIELLINVLRGSGMREIYEKGLDKIKTYGAGRDLPYLDWKSYITQLINQGILMIDYSKNSSVMLTPFSEVVIKSKQKVELVAFVMEKDKAPALKLGKETIVENTLYEKLRVWRNEVANEKGIPAYTVLNNASLEELSSSKPTELHELMDITGIGKAKMDKYGHTIVNLIKEFIEENKKTTAKKGSTHLVSFEMYEQGLSPKEIADARGIQIQTVFSHLSELYLQGKNVNLKQYILPKKLMEIMKVWKALGKPETLKEIKEALDESYQYEEIRIAITIGKKESE